MLCFGPPSPPGRGHPPAPRRSTILGIGISPHRRHINSLSSPSKRLSFLSENIPNLFLASKTHNKNTSVASPRKVEFQNLPSEEQRHARGRKYSCFDAASDAKVDKESLSPFWAPPNGISPETSSVNLLIGSEGARSDPIKWCPQSLKKLYEKRMKRTFPRESHSILSSLSPPKAESRKNCKSRHSLPTTLDILPRITTNAGSQIAGMSQMASQITSPPPPAHTVSLTSLPMVHELVDDDRKALSKKSSLTLNGSSDTKGPQSLIFQFPPHISNHPTSTPPDPFYRTASEETSAASPQFLSN